MTVSASDSGSRPPRISWLAAWTIERVTASGQGNGEIAAEDALLLAALDQGLQLVEHRDVTPV